MNGNHKNPLVRLNPEAHRKLKELADHNNRPMSRQIVMLIEQEHAQIFKVISISELPHPADADAEAVPVLNVAPDE